MNVLKRKTLRLKDYDYSLPNAYFITICTKNKKQILSQITVGDDDLIVPKNHLSKYGLICDKYIKNISMVYENVTVDKYVIMPNHIHLIITIKGTMMASSPTKSISNIIRSFKTLVSKEIGNSIWQRSYYDHIIRSEADYQSVWEYIDTNILKWKNDRLYSD
ncbi:MAG: transposase [Clostridia bacterium]|nr:transposase [Clostridia bacterium]